MIPASATVGTVEVRSLCEPWRKIIARVKGHFISSRACGLELEEKLIEIQGQGGEENFYLPVRWSSYLPSPRSPSMWCKLIYGIYQYDRLILAMGSTNATHGVPGLENCFQLKTVSDAQQIRRRIMDNLERACFPSVSEVERKRLLSFVICGGGPTGVEMAAELFDMINEDVLSYVSTIFARIRTTLVLTQEVMA